MTNCSTCGLLISERHTQCADCITADTPERKRPKCAQGHPCVMMPSHRWVCTECFAYAEGFNYEDPGLGREGDGR